MTEREQLIDLLTDVLGMSIAAKADHLLSNGVTLQRWIPVTERLPEANDRYLCNVKSFAFPGCFYQTILKYDKYGFLEGHIYTDDVTHWMPLPEPPKEEIGLNDTVIVEKEGDQGGQ